MKKYLKIAFLVISAVPFINFQLKGAEVNLQYKMAVSAADRWISSRLSDAYSTLDINDAQKMINQVESIIGKIDGIGDELIRYQTALVMMNPAKYDPTQRDETGTIKYPEAKVLRVVPNK